MYNNRYKTKKVKLEHRIKLNHNIHVQCVQTGGKRSMVIIFTRSCICTFIAFDKERVHNAVEINIFGLCIHRHQFAPSPPKIYSGANDVISIDHVLCF